MKKILFATIMAAALSASMVSTQAAAGDTVFGGLGDAIMKGRNAIRDTIPTEVKALEADGGNFRYYEWVAPKNPNTVCWIAAGTQKGAGGCYQLPENRSKN